MSVATVTRLQSQETQFIDAMCQLTLNPSNAGAAVAYVATLTPEQRDEFLQLADANHVVLRTLQPILDGATDPHVRRWAENAATAERARIDNALKHLADICGELESGGCPTTVIKTLEHMPDLGNDLDLYTTAPEDRVVAVMTSKFSAHVEPRSWGDRLANKWNFAIPGLKESVEVHVQRLGQTGEHTRLAQRFVTRRQRRQAAGCYFFAPAAEEAVIVATLQRMYRHFYFRVCDIVNVARLVESGELDYTELKRAADEGGIWQGVATFLQIVSDYVKRYRGAGLDLPASVTSAAQFGGEKISVKARFLRVPVMPEGAALYTRQVTNTALKGDVPATFRLSLLPYLASAAAIAFKFTGSDKGIW